MDTREIAQKTFQKVTQGKEGNKEGDVAKAIESETSKLSSDLFLWTGLGCLGASAILRMVGLNSVGQIVGQFASPILIMGLYNKVVKLHGSERPDHGMAR